jgi:hypothetical protein
MQHNVFEDNVPNEGVATEYIALESVIDFADFKYDHTYREQEGVLLVPQLEALGYTHITWQPGEYDSFGPLTRVCRARNRFNEVVWFIYG